MFLKKNYLFIFIYFGWFACFGCVNFCCGGNQTFRVLQNEPIVFKIANFNLKSRNIKPMISSRNVDPWISMRCAA